ncbi:MAG: hypothetical protein IKZ59_00405 [Clostridia bacterium]|nr:hypothetical protein [Clostridia bacterium]
MNTIKLKYYGNTKMIAHRGLSGLYVENTLGAFKAAGKSGYYGIESDVHVTLDGKFIIFHDNTTKRLSPIKVNVEKTNYAVLRLIPVKFHRMPNLTEYITCCKEYGKIAVLELKNPMSKENIRDIVREIEDAGYLESTVFISFSSQNLMYIREIKPNQNVQFLTDDFNAEVLDLLINNRFDLDINFTSLSAEIIKKCHNNGIKVNCWTVNEPADAERLIEYGVDYITTNIIE